MRLGAYFPPISSQTNWEALCDRLDCYGLSALTAPTDIETMSNDDGDGIREVHINTCEGSGQTCLLFCDLSKAFTNAS